MIYLTGAGCGNWELLTLRAMRMIQKADCILYDRLLDPEILTFAPKHCDCIYVGKKAGKHAMAQEEIQRLMIEKAARFDTVVRLKGGDPCVFGRVGEEAQALAQAHVPFEIIPGISSGIGGLAFAGIPITHRDYASGARLMSAHGKAGTMSDLDYAGMAHTRDTLIFYMGLQQLSAIVSGLMQAGRNPNTPIALVSNAGRATQTMVTATLKDIEDRDLSAIVSPALIVIGGVINLQEKLNFMKRRPLFQKRYLLPQFADAKRELQLELQDLGAAVDCITTGRICANPALLDDVNLQIFLYFQAAMPLRFSLHSWCSADRMYVSFLLLKSPWWVRKAGRCWPAMAYRRTYSRSRRTASIWHWSCKSIFQKMTVSCL